MKKALLSCSFKNCILFQRNKRDIKKMLESMGLPSKVDAKGGEGGAVTWDEEALNKMSKFAKGGAGDKR